LVHGTLVLELILPSLSDIVITAPNELKPMLAGKAGKDMYELDERLIVWGNISKEMGHMLIPRHQGKSWSPPPTTRLGSWYPGARAYSSIAE
jgi:hypothetical protein